MIEPLEGPEPHKLYVIVREDLPPGLRAAQAAHAVAEICLKHPEAAWKWHQEGNYLIILSETDAYWLGRFFGIFDGNRLFPALAFYEPDLDDEITSFACLPSPEANHLFDGFPLAYKPKSHGFKAWVIRKLGGEP